MITSLLARIWPTAILWVVLALGGYTLGVIKTNEGHRNKALAQTVRELTVAAAAKDLDSIRLVEQQALIENLNKEIDDARDKLSDKSRVCFDAGDTDQLRNLWK
ncbi:hypothetical protein [Rhizobium arsenicireducens]